MKLKKPDDLSHWAKMRDAEEDGFEFQVISDAWSAIKDRWSESLEGKVAVISIAACMVLAIIIIFGFGLNSYFPTFDPSR